MFSIDRTEFDRLQTQLIELRTANYQLKENHSKTSTELGQLQHTVQSQARELDRANKSIQRSKKAKEFSSLAEENDLLQQKLDRQEDDFRLQNRTLMEELSKVCDEKEAMKRELDKLKSEMDDGRGRGGGGGGGGALADQATHLQAENTALIKSMQALQERLKEASSNHTDQNSNEVGSNSVQPVSDRELELQLRLTTEEEEKRLLHEKLFECQESFQTQETELKSSIAKLTEKVKKKQDSLLQLQEEKEKQFHENRAAMNELTRAKDHEIHSLLTRVQHMTQELEASKQITEVGEEVQKELDGLKQRNEELTLRCATLKTEKEYLVHEKTEQRDLLAELGRELQGAKAHLGEGKKTSHDLETQLQEARLSQEQLADQVVKTSEEKHVIMAELEAAQKLAEKRKTLLDSMAIQSQEASSGLQNKMGSLEERHREEVSKLEEQLRHEQSRNWKLTESLEELGVLRKRSEEVQDRLKETEEEVKRVEGELAEERSDKEQKMEQLTQQHQQENQNLCKELEECKGSLEEKQKELLSLAGKVEDKQENVRIVERKSHALIKDLKRQLQQMQKREDRLHEQLSALRGVQVVEVRKEISHDTSSNHSRESSLSSMRGLLKSDSVDVTSPTYHLVNSEGNQMGVGVSEETQELLARVAELQKEKWALDERVHHLENTGSALAEDVIQKSEIIKNYFMETRADHNPGAAAAKRSTMEKLSPMKLMPWTRSNKEGTLEEINRKMQRALEEALMKNIHLQENVAMLSDSMEQVSAGNHSPSTVSKQQHMATPPDQNDSPHS